MQDKLIAKEIEGEKGVFAAKDYMEQELILEFKGKIYKRSELPQPYDSVDDHYIQVGENDYMGPSGELDDLINHSCNPNSFLKFLDNKVSLFALRKIGTGEEITFDYSTTMDEDEWTLECHCNAPNCRGTIKDFKYLPVEIQESYLRIGCVADYIAKSISKVTKTPNRLS